MSTQQRQTNTPKGMTGVAVPAGLLIGIGVGVLVGEVVAWTLIGLGAGFAGMILLRAIFGEW
jgi:hypothetical protein